MHKGKVLPAFGNILAPSGKRQDHASPEHECLVGMANVVRPTVRRVDPEGEEWSPTQHVQ
jgi:hypothetical protein